MNTTSPINEKKRLVWIDAARGFAIFGIFIVNVGAFSSPYFMYGGESELWEGPINHSIQVIIDMFFQASFYTLFSILFGFGFQIMKERIEARNDSLYPILFRRMAVLLLFGSIHAFGIWHGDILFSYSIVGFLLLFFLHVRTNTLLVTATMLLGGSVAFISLMYYTARDYLGVVNTLKISQALEHYSSNDITTIWSQNYNDWTYANGGIGFVFLILVLLPLFLIGMFVAKKRWLHEPMMYRKTLVKLWIASLLVFVSLKLGPYFYGNPLWFSYVQDNIGGTASALFYIITITFLGQTDLGKKLTRPFTYVGRMALSNYIFQSLLSFILFYGVGFGLYGKITPLMGVCIVVIVYVFQVFVSKRWFEKYRFGPLEWVWRSLTYKRRQPFIKK
ncbi:DUF418 domain-containing protein [Oceanobacillus bengalensis]|uniref:DUF418 domain-containing protein n=1 Tax=Oceanobacillus bengalensis TaxID=1435466 RepID=UPI0026872E43